MHTHPPTYPPTPINHCPHASLHSPQYPHSVIFSDRSPSPPPLFTHHYQRKPPPSATPSCTHSLIPMKPPQQQPPIPKSFTVSSSPGRAEKLPAPGLARLLRGKSGSRSTRGGPARSSPMFVSRNKSLNRSSSSSALAAGAANGEPTSPKVTCIGQVRIRNRHKKNKNKKVKKDPRSDETWSCLQRPLLCKFRFRILPKRKKKRDCCKFFCWRRHRHHHHHHHSSNNNELKEADEAPPIAFVREMRVEESEDEEEEEAEDEETKGFVSSSSAEATTHSSEVGAGCPPKNALLLMRCRSAPHNRSSALSLCRFPVLPVPASESEEDEEKTGTTIDEEEEKSRCSSTIEVLTTTMAVGLMRCKSEPAKTGEKLMEVSCGKGNGGGSGSGSGGAEVKEVGPRQSPSPILLLH